VPRSAALLAILVTAVALSAGCAETVTEGTPAANPAQVASQPPGAAPQAPPSSSQWPMALGTGYYVEEGTAYYYGRRFHGRRTASGERFDMHALTAAHRQLPLGSVVRVTHLRTGRQVVVRVNDRGPYGRRTKVGPKGEPIGSYRGAMDLAMGAAKVLGMLEAGSAPVRIELVALPASIRRR
jgi:rare lipoprotein A